MIDRKETTTTAGNKINYPEETILPLQAKEELDQAISAIENAVGQECYAAYLNPDHDNPERLHDIKIVFRKS